MTAATSGVYHVSATLPANATVLSWEAKPVSIDAGMVIAALKAIEVESTNWKQRLREIPFIEIEYEAYVRNQSSCNAQILDFLEVSQCSLTSDLKKLNPDRLQDLIVNYDEIAKAIRSTPYALCLDADQ